MSLAAPVRRAGVAVPAWLAIVRRRPFIVAFVLGGLVALALAPFYLWPTLFGFAGLLHLLRRIERRWQALLLGWSFGFGHLLAGLYWIGIAFFTDPERFGALAVPAVVLLCAGLAIYPALAAWLTVLYRWRSPIAAALALALTWTATEALRGTLFGGFPWNLIGYVWTGSTAISQLAAVTGAYGLSLMAVLLGALPVVLLEAEGWRRHWRPLAVAALGLALIWAGGAARLAGAESSAVPGVRLRLVQGNIAQHHKWQPELRARWFQRYLDLSARSPDDVTDVIWPESATPYPLEQDPTARAMVAAVVPPGGLLVTGGERFDLSSEPPRAWNSLFVVDGQGTVRARYDKRDLVPFGEFLPLRGLLGRLGLEKLTQGSIDFQPGPGRETIAVPGLPPFSPLICYEAIFPGRVVNPGDRPAWLLNVTNDAWFGRSTGPYQHFAMARMRAVEEGLPLVRSANTGISAVIDPWGRVTASLGLDETGVLDAALPQPLLAPTIYARLGAWSVIVLAGAAAMAMVFVEIRAREAAREVNKSAKPATTG